MARPKLGRGETERLHMVITADELREIENWRRVCGIASKSAAIRMLVQIGLKAEAAIDDPEVLDRVAAASRKAVEDTVHLERSVSFEETSHLVARAVVASMRTSPARRSP